MWASLLIEPVGTSNSLNWGPLIVYLKHPNLHAIEKAFNKWESHNPISPKIIYVSNLLKILRICFWIEWRISSHLSKYRLKFFRKSLQLTIIFIKRIGMEILYGSTALKNNLDFFINWWTKETFSRLLTFKGT